MAIRCCKDCVPPKRFVGCHSTCPDYLREKEEWDNTRKRMQAQRDAGMDFDKYYKRLYTRKKVGNRWKGRAQ